MEKEPNQLYQSLDKLAQENLDLSIKLHAANKDIFKLKLAAKRSETEFADLTIKLEKSNDGVK